MTVEAIVRKGLKTARVPLSEGSERCYSPKAFVYVDIQVLPNDRVKVTRQMGGEREPEVVFEENDINSKSLKFLLGGEKIVWSPNGR